MDLKQALEQADQILDEERASPTVSYDAAPPEKESATWDMLSPLLQITLNKERKKFPREVLENPRKYKFGSVNYTLLQALLSQIPMEDRSKFLSHAAARIQRNRCARNRKGAYPTWNYLVSELPLVAELLTRNGAKETLFETLADKGLHVSPAHAVLLIQIEDMISLNYSLFTNAEYARLSSVIDGFAKKSQEFRDEYAKEIDRKIRCLEAGQEVSIKHLCEEIRVRCWTIREECRKAGYLYLKVSLLEGLNQEVNEDKSVVENYLQKFGFSQPLIDSLNEADRLYRQEGTQFDLKSCMGHLRSFLENTHKEAAPAIEAKL